MADRTWCQVLRDADQARREGRNPYAKRPAHTDAEIEANWIATFKAESEWDCGDIVEIVTSTKERMSGVITGPVIDGRVMVLFEDGIHWSYAASRCYIRRSDQ